MNSRTFKSENGHELIIKSRRSAVIFEIDKSQDKGNYDFLMTFTPEGFKELLEYIEEISNKSWANIEPKEANSFGADYYEYYDKELDNNGYISFRKNGLFISRPTSDHVRLYQFNKRKMESFIYDFRRNVAEEAK